jgi:hypothetical protein
MMRIPFQRNLVTEERKAARGSDVRRQRVTELFAHLLPDHLARARNAVNLGPTLQTVAATVAVGTKPGNSPRKTHKRH